MEKVVAAAPAAQPMWRRLSTAVGITTDPQHAAQQLQVGSPLTHICTGTGAHPPTSVPGLGLTPPTSAPGLGSPRPHRHRDWVHPAHICAGTALLGPAGFVRRALSARPRFPGPDRVLGVLPPGHFRPPHALGAVGSVFAAGPDRAAPLRRALASHHRARDGVRREHRQRRGRAGRVALQGAPPRR
jgi:hypothetical protein